MDTWEAFISVLIIQFSLHSKAPFVSITKCIHYAGVLAYFQVSC